MSSAADQRAWEIIEKARQERSFELDLGGLGLKSVPELPAELRGLKKLTLSGNRLKELPPQLWELSLLENLDLGNNRLSALPPGIGRLPELRWLDASENNLRSLPAEIGRCMALAELHLYGNQLSGLIDPGPTFDQLEVLDLSSNRLRSISGFDRLCPNLRHLDISRNQFDAVPAGIGNLGRLAVVDLAYNRVASIEELFRLLQLEELYLDDNLLAAFPRELLNFDYLKVLSVEGNPFEELPGDFGSMGTEALRRGARAVVSSYISGDPVAGKEYVSAPSYKFDFALGVGGVAGALKVTDLYYKRAGAAWPASLTFPDGAVLDLGRMSRKAAIRAVGDHEASLQSGQVLLEFATADRDRLEKTALVVDAISQLPSSELIPKQAGDEVIQFTNLNVTPRYADVTFYREQEQQSGVRDGALESGRPLQMGKWYQIEIAVRQKRTGIPSTSDRPIVEPQQSGPVKVLVTAESDDFEIPEPASELTLPPGGDSTENAYLRLRPMRTSADGKTLSGLRVRLFYRLQLLEMFTIEAEVLEAGATQSRQGLARPVYVSPERFCQTEPSDLDLLKPRVLHIEIDRRDGAYVFTFTTQVPGLDKIALSGPVALQPQQLNPVIVGARKTLMGIASSDNLASSIDGKDAEYRAQLLKLADCGSQLWTLLFGMDPQSALSGIGRWLKETPPADGSSIQISITPKASDFVFPWALLYDRTSPDQENVSEQGFWGLRYVIEQRVIMATAPQRPIEAPPLEVGMLMWRFKQAKEQAAYLADLVSQAKGTIATGSPIMELAVARKYMQACTANILYFFTHGHTQLPDAERYGFSEADFVGLYDRLAADSPLRDDWKYTYQSIKSRLYNSDRSWIEVGRSADTDGFLFLQDLYASIQALTGRPIVILNMCESAQVTPSLSMSFIHFFITRGARAVTGTECPMRPAYADYVGREMMRSLLQGDSVGTALRNIRLESVRRKNPLGFAYNIFGCVDARIEPALLAKADTAATAAG